jgi:tetratricopeptide (TPR) repeat protein
MSRSRNDPHKAKQRRERLRKLKAELAAGPPAAMPAEPQRMAGERVMQDLHALLGGGEYESVEDLNAKLAELTSGWELGAKVAKKRGGDSKWKAQQLAYDAMETRSARDAMRLVKQALALDPGCIDARCQFVTLAGKPIPESIELLELTLQIGQAELGEAFFEENKGHFWGILETRPYMRACHLLANYLTRAERLEDAVALYERMLELNESDNMGVRYLLVALHLAQREAAKAKGVLDKFKDEEESAATLSWARVMTCFLAGHMKRAEAALERARKANPYLESYLSGARALPREAPESYRLGGAEEAAVAAVELAPALRAMPDFSRWLREKSQGLAG